MRTNTLFSTIALCAATVAADQTTQILLAGFDPQSIVGSVIASDSTATTFSIACVTSAKCELPSNFIFTQGPSTIHYAYTHSAQSSDDFTGTIEVACAVTTDHGSCTKSVTAGLGTITSTATSSITTFSDASAMGAQILTVTAGNLVLPTSASSTSYSTSSHSSSSGSSSSPSQSHPSASVKSSSSLSSASYPSNTSSAPNTTPAPTAAPSSSTPPDTVVKSSSSSTGGVPRITENVQWVMGGAAAVVAFAAL